MRMKRIVFAIIAGFSIGAFAQEKLVIDVNFDKWELKLIDKGLAATIKSFKEKEYPIPVEVQGPSYRAFEPSFGIPGIMVPEKEAVKGNAVFFESGKESYAVGEHSPFGQFLNPEKEYRYEIYLKGKGEFTFNAWLVGVNAEGKSNFLGLAALIRVKAEEGEWKKYEGTFKIPANTDKEYTQYNTSLLGGIMIPPNAKLYIDEFKIWEK
jgi:hypothetical protein